MIKSAKSLTLFLIMSLLAMAASASVVSSQTAGGKYDTDSDKLIEISNLEQLDAVRYDLDGDGDPDSADNTAAYAAAFPTTTGKWSATDARGMSWSALWTSMTLPATPPALSTPIGLPVKGGYHTPMTISRNLAPPSMATNTRFPASM